MSDREWLTEGFEANRAHLRAVAYRMLGSSREAEDAVQESWIRLNRSDTADVENLGGWLTTVVARVCLDMLRSRTSRREDPFEDGPPERAAEPESSTDPEHEALLADSVGLAMLVVLDTLTPAERVSFVLHDTAPRWRWAPMRRLGGPRRSPRRSPAGRAPHNRRSWGGRGARLGAGRGAQGGVHVLDRGRADRGHRPDRRSRSHPGARRRGPLKADPGLTGSVLICILPVS